MTNRNLIQKKAKKVSFNIVDVLICAVLLIFLAYVIFTYAIGGSIRDLKATDVRVEYTVIIEKVIPEYYHEIKIGDTLKSRDGSLPLGKVAGKTEIAEDGSATIIIQSDAHRSQRSYRIGDQKIDPGTKLEIRFPDYAPSSTVKCTSIKVI